MIHRLCLCVGFAFQGVDIINKLLPLLATKVSLCCAAVQAILYFEKLLTNVRECECGEMGLSLEASVLLISSTIQFIIGASQQLQSVCLLALSIVRLETGAY